jgi:hypothetical protein
MFVALRILITDPRWFFTVYRFYRDGRWNEDAPRSAPALAGTSRSPRRIAHKRRRALWKIFCDNG